MTHLFLSICVLCCFQFLAAQENSIIESDSASVSHYKKIDSLWNQLVFDKGGCLTGGQRVRDGKFGGEACVMTDYRRRGVGWKLLFNYPKQELHSFFISKLADTATTNIHTCPCATATAGEVAVYSLQKLHLVNWYDFDVFIEYKNKEMTSCLDGEQAWLQNILITPRERKKLVKAFNGLL